MYLASIKQTSLRNVNNETIEVEFNIDPESDEHDELILPITVRTTNEELKKFLGLEDTAFSGTLEELNERIKQFPSS